MRILLLAVCNSSFERGHRSVFCCADIMVIGKKGRYFFLSTSCHLFMYINLICIAVVRALSLYVREHMARLNQPYPFGLGRSGVSLSVFDVYWIYLASSSMQFWLSMASLRVWGTTMLFLKITCSTVPNWATDLQSSVVGIQTGHTGRVTSPTSSSPCLHDFMYCIFIEKERTFSRMWMIINEK